MSKAALNMLSAGQLDSGVPAIALRPGTVDTAMLQSVLDPEVEKRTARFSKTVRAAYDSGKVLHPDQPGRAIAVLAAAKEWPAEIFTVTQKKKISSVSACAIDPLPVRQRESAGVQGKSEKRVR